MPHPTLTAHTSRQQGPRTGARAAPEGHKHSTAMKVIINPAYEHLRPFIESLPQRITAEGETIHEGRNLIKMLTAPGGLRLNVKRYHRPSLLNALIYSLRLRTPKGVRAYRYPGRLTAKGFDTPEAVAYIEQHEHGLMAFSFFVSVQCDYPHRLYEIAHAAPEVYMPLAKAIARFTASMHDSDIMHLDYSPGNVLWDLRDGKYVFSLVDINRMAFRKIGMKEGCRNFARLWGPKQFVRTIAREYAACRGLDPDDCEDITMTFRFKFWNRYLRKHSVPFSVEM